MAYPAPSTVPRDISKAIELANAKQATYAERRRRWAAEWEAAMAERQNRQFEETAR